MFVLQIPCLAPGGLARRSGQPDDCLPPRTRLQGERRAEVLRHKIKVGLDHLEQDCSLGNKEESVAKETSIYEV